MNDKKHFFARALDYTLQMECSNTDTCKFTDDPADSGGATKFGITAKTLSLWLNRPVSKSDVETLSKETITHIYKSFYWDKLNCDKITCYQIATGIFDTSVLFGVVTAAKISQRALQLSFDPKIIPDGIIGDKTIDALNAVNPFAFINTFKLLLLHRIDDIVSKDPKNSKWANGWTNRVNYMNYLF